MAQIQTAVTVPPTRLPLIAPIGEPEIWWTHLPKAELIFNSYNTAVTLAGVGDTQVLSLTCELPKGYAYVMREMSMFMFGVGQNDWDLSTFCQLQDAAVPRWAITIPFQGVVQGASPTLENTTYFLQGPPPEKTAIIVSDGAKLFFDVYNTQTNGAAQTIRFFARFLQFDLNQAFRTSLNSPILTR